MINETRVGDLREKKAWNAWVELQTEPVRAVLRMAAFQYLEEADTISLVFPNASLGQLTPTLCEHFIEQMRALHQDRLGRWLDQTGDASATVGPPKAAVMPNLSIEIAPPFLASH